MRLAIASGKGGTGKTTLALALASLVKGAVLVDADVEEPNLALFFCGSDRRTQGVDLLIPKIDHERCTACGDCVRFCRFNALALAGGKVMLFDELCHGCGGCTLACPTEAISEVPLKVGEIKELVKDDHLLFEGRMEVGRVSAPLIISELLELTSEFDSVIIDAPPGTACNMVEAVSQADYTLLVTEPTPFGLQDLDLAVETLIRLERKFGVVVNRVNLGDERIREYCAKRSIPIHLELPWRREIAQVLAGGGTLLEAAPDLKPGLVELLSGLGLEVVE